jgi:aspartyl-tRNA synthetase
MLRTQLCGDARKEQIGQQVTLCGWVWRWRDHGGVVFIDLRDYTGHTQVVFKPEHNPDIHAIAQTLRNESVIRVTGVIESRLEGTINETIPTGEVEMLADKLEVLNKSETPPFQIEDDCDAGEEIRLQYRYLDLRRPSIQKNLRLRHRAIKTMRDYCDREGFIEVETPTLTKSTPEGARDYLVPSRIQNGSFYALPQSPQIYKQLLQVGGIDRYVQIARCYRDEDQRADRQPEFTQLDMEMSYADEEDIYAIIEGMVQQTMKETLGAEVKTPFPRIPYHEAMERYGSDKPDTRYGLELNDLCSVAAECDFKVFKGAVESGGVVFALNAKGCLKYSRKDIDNLTKFVSIYGARGLAYIQVAEEGLKSSVVKFFSPELQKKIIEITKAETGDLLLFGAGSKKVVFDAMGQLRCEIARREGLVPKGMWNYLWVTDFPLFEEDENGRPAAVHHPFTGLHAHDLEKLSSDPLSIKARCYDLVLNGVELGSGSIRINQPEVQSKVFDALGIGAKEAEEKFGFLTTAFKYGAPPHGGIALGLDRLVALMCGLDSIRDVIAFPKTQRACGLMEDCPTPVDEAQLSEVGIRLRKQPGA